MTSRPASAAAKRNENAMALDQRVDHVSANVAVMTHVNILRKCSDLLHVDPFITVFRPQVTGTIRRDLEALRDEFEAQRNAGPILEEAVAAERQANQQAFRELRNAIKTIGKKTQELTKLAERQVEEIEQEKLRNKKAYQELSSKVEAISTQTQEAILSATQEVRQAKQESEKQYAALYSMLVAVGIVVKGNEQSLQVERRRLQSLSEGFACMPSSSEAMVYGQHTILEDSTIMPGSEASTLGGDMVTRELDKSNRRIDGYYM